MVKGNTKRARELLLADLEELHLIKGWRIECVFDGFGRSITGPLGSSPGGSGVNERVPQWERQVTKSDAGRGVRTVYSGVGASADSYIESRCLSAKSITDGKLTGQLIVVSNDGMIRIVATGAGALCMSSDRLVDELKAVRKSSEYRVEVALAEANGGYVRPEGLRNSQSEGAKKLQALHHFKGGSIIMDDEVRKKKKSSLDNDDSDGDAHGEGSHSKPVKKLVLEELAKDTNIFQSWDMLPTDTKFNKR